MLRWFLSLFGPRCECGSLAGNYCNRRARWRSPGVVLASFPPEKLVWCDEHRHAEDVPIDDPPNLDMELSLLVSSSVDIDTDSKRSLDRWAKAQRRFMDAVYAPLGRKAYRPHETTLAIAIETLCDVEMGAQRGWRHDWFAATSPDEQRVKVLTLIGEIRACQKRR